jgi:hypothetical protein
MIAVMLSLPPAPSHTWKEGSPMPHKKASHWLFSDSVTKEIQPVFSQATRDTVAPTTADSSTATVVPGPDPVEAKSLPLGWILDPEKGHGLSERVLARLLQAEAHEPEYLYRDDIRIAWLTVLHCQRGDAVECTPHVLATYEVLGCHPEQVYARIILRRVAMFNAHDNLLKFPSPKLSPKSSPKKSDEEKSA